MSACLTSRSRGTERPRITRLASVRCASPASPSPRSDARAPRGALPRLRLHRVGHRSRSHRSSIQGPRRPRSRGVLRRRARVRASCQRPALHRVAARRDGAAPGGVRQIVRSRAASHAADSASAPLDPRPRSRGPPLDSPAHAHRGRVHRAVLRRRGRRLDARRGPSTRRVLDTGTRDGLASSLRARAAGQARASRTSFRAPRPEAPASD